MKKHLLYLTLLASTPVSWISPANSQQNQFNKELEFLKDLKVLAQYMPGYAENPIAVYKPLVEKIFQDKTTNIPAMHNIAEDLTHGFPNILKYSKAPCINDNDPDIEQPSNIEKTGVLLELTKTINGEKIPTQIATNLLRSIDLLLGLFQNKKMAACNTQMNALLQTDQTKTLSQLLYTTSLLHLPKNFIHFLTNYVSPQLVQNFQGQINSPQLHAQIEPIIPLLGHNTDTHTIRHPAKAKEGHKLQTHGEKLTNLVAFLSYDGKLLVTASDDNTAKILDVKTGQFVFGLTGHPGTLNSANFSPFGKLLVTADGDNTAKIWNTQTNKCIQTLEGHTSWVKSAAFSHNGKLIVTISGDLTAKIWDTQTGKCIHTLEGHTNWVKSAAFSADDTIIVTTSWDQTAKIWDTKTGKCIHTLQGNNSGIQRSAFSYDGKLIVTVSGEKTAKIWDTKTGNCNHTLEGHTSWLTSAAFSHNGKLIVTISGDSTAKIWDTQTGKCIHTLKGHTSWFNSATFSPDDTIIVTTSGDETANIWDTKTGKCIGTLQGHTGRTKSAAFSHDGKLLITVSWDYLTKILEVKTWEISSQARVTAAEYIIYQAFIKSDLQAVQLVTGSYGAQIINQLNSRVPADQPIIPVQ